MKRKPKKKTSKYKSGLEEQVAKLLEGLGVSYEYESCKIPYTIQHNYHPDFIIDDSSCEYTSEFNTELYNVCHNCDCECICVGNYDVDGNYIGNSQGNYRGSIQR